MACTFALQAVDQCLPLSRQELLSNVVVERLYGEITNIWHHPGHVFISTDNGRKLFTFDCSPIHPQNGFSNASLDIHNSPSSIMDVILISPSLALVVENNGHTQWWRYTSDCDWVHIGNMELCNLVQSCIVSIAFLSGSSTLVWCEGKEKHRTESPQHLSDKTQSTFCIKSKSVSVSDITAQTLREQEVEQNVTLAENCPASDVFSIAANNVCIRTKVVKDQITVSLVYCPDFSDVTMFIGQDTFDVNMSSTSSNPLDFRSLLLKHLPTTIKMELNYGDLGTNQDENKIVALSSCGLMEVFHFTGSDKKKMTHRVIPLSLDDSSILANSWFLHKKHVGVIYNQKVCLYSLHDGSCTSKWTSDDISGVTRVIPSASPAFLAWILKSNGLTALQATDSRMKTNYTLPNSLPDDELLETAVLQLTHLHQLKQSGYDKKVTDKLERLKQSWSEGRGSHQSQIVDMLAPLLDEYWRLDDASKVLSEKQEHPQPNSSDEIAYNRFTDEMSKTGGLPRRAKESRLLWLSQMYPHQLLECLTQGITLDCDEVLENELPRWQTMLGIEGWDLTRFELVCRLLYQHHPQKLCHFVKCAESVSEQTVGVSAFVRKKHTLIFYRGALECLPLAETSCDPCVAAAAHGKLILAGGGADCVEKALKHLLDHGLWREAVDLVKTQASTDQDKLPSYVYITVTALAQSQSLSEFVPEILVLMPSWKSFLSFSHVTTCQPDIRQRQLSTSASDLFCHQDDPNDVSIGDVKPFLVELIKKMSSNN